jgi:large subunit ribosomal protein L23
VAEYFEVIEKPIVSEKSMKGAPRGKYAFRVNPKANKIEIRSAIEQYYKVKVKAVNTMTVKGKSRRIGRFPEGRTSDWKKAVVTLAPGERIDILEGV